MITEINIKNFKSIVDLTLPLSSFNVLIGENGCGKSNILEAIGFASLAESGIDNETLHSKGIRNAKPSLIFNSFANAKRKKDFVGIRIKDAALSEPITYTIEVSNKEDPFPEWTQTTATLWFSQDEIKEFHRLRKMSGLKNIKELIVLTAHVGAKRILSEGINWESLPRKVLHPNQKIAADLEDYLSQFLIYTPNTLALRGLRSDSQREPLGIYGENLDVLISSFTKDEMSQLEEHFNLISWLDDLSVDQNDTLKFKGFKVGRSQSKLYFKDKFMARGGNVFSAENANEGILYLLFYLALFISKRTPDFFAIDNIEAALNPKLCRTLIKMLSDIAIENGKQVVISTHHPAVLDGLNLNDDRQRLFVVKRNDEGHTQIERVKVKPSTNGENLKLSEIWMRGNLGAIPNNFF